MRRKFTKVRTQPIKVDYFNRFDGGLNLFISDIHLKKNESPNCMNVEPDEDGIVKTRYGFSRLGAIGTVGVQGLGGLNKDDGSRYLLKAGDTVLKVYNPTTKAWDTVSGVTYTAGKRTDFCQAYNKTFIQNGTDALSYFNGTNTVAQLNGQKGEFSIYFNGMLVTNDPLNPSRIYFSGSGVNIGDFSSGAGGEFIDINASDGDFITSLAKYGTGSDNVILIYKQNSTYKVYFDDAGLPVVQTVSPSRGAECHWAVDNMEDDIIFFSNLPAIMTQGAQENFFSQIRTNELSLFVNRELETMNRRRKKQTAGIYHKHRYFFAYAGSGDESNNKILMFDKRYKSWWYWEGISANCFMYWEDLNGDEHFLFGSDDGNAYEFDLNRNDNDAIIHSYFDTKAFNMDEFDRTKYFPFVTALFRNVIGTVNVKVILDELTISKSTAIGITGILAGVGASLIGFFMPGDDGQDNTETQTDVSRPKRIMIRKKARSIKLRFETNKLNSYFSLLDLGIASKKKSIRRFNSEDIIR